ncbi:MAG: transcription elongation factor GreA [Candidatus Hydrogenedentota bacterium]
MSRLNVSPEGLQKLKDELEACQKRKMEVAAIIEHARSFGDLRENADYHAAKEEQAMLHARIRDIGDKIARSVVIEHDKIDGNKALIGATVKVRNKKTNKDTVFILVSPVEADATTGKISVRSPVGEALLGKEVGEVAVAKVPAGNLEFEILEISR